MAPGMAQVTDICPTGARGGHTVGVGAIYQFINYGLKDIEQLSINFGGPKSFHVKLPGDLCDCCSPSSGVISAGIEGWADGTVS